MNILTNPAAVVTIIVSLILLSTPIIPIEITETSYTSEPYTYEQSLVRVNQVRKFPWIYEVTRAQYIIKNTDIEKGTFDLNFIFDNGVDTETSTKTVTILAGEEKAEAVDSPLKGESTITLNVIPPKKSIPQEHTVTKNVNAWHFLGRVIFRFR